MAEQGHPSVRCCVGATLDALQRSPTIWKTTSPHAVLDDQMVGNHELRTFRVMSWQSEGSGRMSFSLF